jgi:hypothetical protein
MRATLIIAGELTWLLITREGHDWGRCHRNRPAWPPGIYITGWVLTQQRMYNFGFWGWAASNFEKYPTFRQTFQVPSSGWYYKHSFFYNAWKSIQVVHFFPEKEYIHRLTGIIIIIIECRERLELLLHTTEVPGSNLGPKTGYTSWGSLWFSSIPSDKCQDRPQVRPGPLPSASFEIRYPWLIQSLDWEIVWATDSVIKPKIKYNLYHK